MQFYNPTGNHIELTAHGQEYQFEPFSEEVVWNPDHQQFIQTAKSYLGVVPLDYEEEAKRLSLKKFPNQNQDVERKDFVKKIKSDQSFQDKYKKEQALKGLNNVRNHYLYLYNNELKVETEIDSRKGKADLEKFHLRSDDFKNKLEEVMGWIKSLEAPEKKNARAN